MAGRFRDVCWTIREEMEDAMAAVLPAERLPPFVLPSWNLNWGYQA